MNSDSGNGQLRGVPLRVIRFVSFEDQATLQQVHRLSLPCFTVDLEDRLVRWPVRDLQADMRISHEALYHAQQAHIDLKKDAKRRLCGHLAEALMRSIDL